MPEIERRVGNWLWSERPATSKTRAAAFVGGRYAFALLRDLAAGDLTLRSTSLVYSTMLATAPLLALSFAVLKGLGLHRELAPFLNDVFAPFGPRAADLTARVLRFVDNVSGSGLAGVSIVLLVITALGMAQKVEVSLNFVWNVDRPRSFARRFSEYLSVMLVGPILMSLAMGIIAAVSSTALMNRLRASDPFGHWLAWLSTLTPSLLLIAGFWLLYRLVPNTRVRTRPAAIGGVFAGVVWATGGSVFAALVVNASRYEAIYSGFAIVVLTMLWLNFSWIIVLLGAQLAFYVQHPESMRNGRRDLVASNAQSERLALGAMFLVGRAFAERGANYGIDRLAGGLDVPRHLVEPVVAALIGRKLLLETVDGQLVPGKDLHALGLEEILAAARGAEGEPRVDRELSPIVQTLARDIEHAIHTTVEGKTLADLVAAAYLPEAAGTETRLSSAHGRPRGAIAPRP
jgi:membrane protein